MHQTEKYGHWWQGPDQKQPALQKDVEVDIAIIGGGFTGMYTALNLAREGADVLILEQDFAGAGASSRNSGYVDGLIGKDYPSLLKMNKQSRARELVGFASNAVKKLEKFIAENQIDCDYVGNGNINAAVHPRQMKRLQKLQEAGKGLGVDFEYLDTAAMRDRGIHKTFVAGVWDPVGGTLNPGKLTKRLREMVLEANIPLYEQTEVLRIRNSDPVVIETKNGVVKAKKVVLATNAFTPHLGWKKRFLSPVWCAMLESAPLNEDQLERIGWKGREGVYTAHEKLESYRMTAGNTLIAGGKFVKIPFGFKLGDIEMPEMADKIEAVFRQRFPDFDELEFPHFWGGWIGIALDFMPGLGVTGKHHNIHYGIGYAGHGIPQTFMVGEILAANVLGKKHPQADILKRRTFPLPPEPFKWLASQAVDRFLGMIDNKTDKLLQREAK